MGHAIGARSDDVAHVAHAGASGASGATVRRATLLGGTALAAAASMWLTPAAIVPATPADVELAWLLRAMVLIKVAMAAAAVVAVDWRLRRPVSAPLLVGYIALPWIAAATLAMLWQLRALGVSALLLHAAAAALLAIAMLDRDVIAERPARHTR